MRRGIVWLVMIMVMLSGCSLQSGSLNVPENSSQSHVTTAPSLTSPPSPTNIPASPTSTQTVKLVAATATPCSLRTVWPLYTVVPGDTLGKIAQQSGTDVASLVAANCLADMNLISVGQQLYVPSLPIVAVDFAMPINPNSVTVAPVIAVEEFAVVVRRGEIVTFSWTGAAPNATSVEFYMQRLDIPVGIQTIGVDTNLADGASMQWPVVSIVATITAVAKQGNIVVNQTTEGLQIQTYASGAVAGQVTISPTLRDDSGWLVLKGGEAVIVSWPYAENLGDVQVHFYAAPSGTGMTPSEIGTDYDVYDGVSIQWVVPVGFMGHISARAGTKGGAVLVANTEQEVAVVAE